VRGSWGKCKHFSKAQLAKTGAFSKAQLAKMWAFFQGTVGKNVSIFQGTAAKNVGIFPRHSWQKHEHFPNQKQSSKKRKIAGGVWKIFNCGFQGMPLTEKTHQMVIFRPKNAICATKEEVQKTCDFTKVLLSVLVESPNCNPPKFQPLTPGRFLALFGQAANKMQYKPYVHSKRRSSVVQQT